MSITQLTAAIAAALALGTAFGQAYPNKPIRLIIPFAPGGSTDIIGRIMSAKLSPILGQPVVVDNKAGAGGSIGAAEIAKAVPDGYTIGMGSVSTMGTNIVAYKNNKLDPVTQFTHITNLAVPGIIVSTDSYKDYKSFVAALKASPGKYSYASSGAGGVGLLMGSSSSRPAPMPAHRLQGCGPAVTDVLAGVPICGTPHRHCRRSRPAISSIGLAFETQTAVAQRADLRRAGFQPKADTWFGLVGPAGMPKDIVKKLHDAAVRR